MSPKQEKVKDMDCINVGKLIRDLRKEKEMTQKQLADAMNISDKTVSKWERGLGCPDVSLLPGLSLILGINIERILLGDLEPSDANGGNMKRLKFYVCPLCGNVMTATGEAEISCCGRKLAPLTPKKADDEHMLNVEQIENDYYITFAHEMSKAHYISFVAYVTYDKVLLVKLYPEQGSELRFPQMFGGKLYYYCNQHELWVA
ncbi:MAG: helix-turn-helix domain-containing protein [Bacteroidales bacterium]|nr:helix-turn-helix domain-containing protein [Bacteroidales bacterium]